MGTLTDRAKAFATNMDGPTATEHAVLLVLIIVIFVVFTGSDRFISIAL